MQNRKIIFLLTFFTLLFFVGCEKKEEEQIKISISSWIGYAPLYYAKQNGLLEGSGIDIVPITSLGESYKMFESGIVEGFCATQYEYEYAKGLRDAVPAFLLDRSFGGDALLSTVDRDSLVLLSDQSIDVYMESGTANEILLKHIKERPLFAKEQNITLNIKNKEQALIADQEIGEEPYLLITYEPYLSAMLAKGMYLICDTTEDPLLILDALFVDKRVFAAHRERFKRLKIAVDTAIKVQIEDPRRFYESVKRFLGYGSYSEYLEAYKKIKWINKDGGEEFLKAISKELDTKELLF